VSTPTRGGRSANVPPSDRATKAERREQARRDREQIQRQIDRRKKTRALILGSILGLCAVVLIAIVVSSGGEDGGTPRAAAGELPGMMTSTSPWGANTEQLLDRLDVLELPALSEAAGALHTHTRLEIWINGQPVEVPANLGFDPDRNALSPLHTHEVDGIVHTESADPGFAPDLGTLFDVWGLRLTGDCIGAYCAEGDRQLQVFVDGEAVTGDPRAVPVGDLETIVIAFGTEDELPDPIPADFVPSA
jgi:hypothetical protein